MKKMEKQFYRTFFRNFFEVSGKSLSAEKCDRGDPLGFFERPFCCKRSKKLKGRPFGDNKKICEKKSHKAEITCTKKFRQGLDSNSRPSAWQTSKTILINLYAKWQ